MICVTPSTRTARQGPNTTALHARNSPGLMVGVEGPSDATAWLLTHYCEEELLLRRGIIAKTNSRGVSDVVSASSAPPYRRKARNGHRCPYHSGRRPPDRPPAASSRGHRMKQSPDRAGSRRVPPPVRQNSGRPAPLSGV